MNNVKNIIAKRRSIRKYKDKKVSSRLIKEIIDAARLAPSGHNDQPSRFYIVRNKKIKNKLKKNKVFERDFVYTAPVIIFCCGDMSVYSKEKSPCPEFDKSYMMRVNIDVSIAAQNLVLRATELGLGTCYIGWMHGARAKKALSINNKYVIPFAIALGYPDEKPKARPREKIEEILLSEL